jgi:chromosome segregation ATPase
MSTQRDAYVEKMKAKLDEWNAEIDKLKARLDQADAESKVEYNRRLEDLRDKRRDVQNRIDEIQRAGENSWDDLKQGLENSWDILKKSVTRAKSEFEQGYKEGRNGS